MTNTKKTAVIFDLDGTLTNYTHRAHHITPPNKNWDAFFNELGKDGLNLVCFGLILEAVRLRHTVILLTGRPETYRLLTMRWLEEHKVPYDLLLMRPKKDFRPNPEIKAELYTNIIAPKYHVAYAADDNPHVIDMWVKQGVKALQFPPLFVTVSKNALH